MKKLLLVTSLFLAPAVLTGQGQGAAEGGLDPAKIYEPLKDDWLTYSGDYTGRRYSALTDINQQTVKNLSLAWTIELSGPPALGGVTFGGGGGAGSNTIIGGVGTGEFTSGSGTPPIKGFILKHDDRIYVSAPDHVWALDARDGREIWHYFWKTRGGTHIGNRGVGLWHNYLFVETPDNYLVSLDARTGQERWAKEFVSFNEQYFSTFPPIVIDNHVIAGTGNDLDMPGILQSFDPETGDLQWKFYTVPMNEGDPGLETWPSLNAARHGGGQVWIPGSFDPETRLYIFGTGNPTPGYTGAGRRGDNLFTCSLVAINVDTGKMAWYFQTSPHDTHDWDSSQTPILIDAEIDGRMRKLVLQAARNGYYFVVDRVTGEHVVTTKAGSTTNWAKGIRPNGSPDPNMDKEALVPGALVSPPEGGVINWPPMAYSPDTGYFYLNEHNGFNILYLMDTDPRGSMGLAGKQRDMVDGGDTFLTAIEATTGEIAWRHKYYGGGGGGMVVTAGRVLFSGDGSGNFVARAVEDGRPLWHARIGNITNAPETYMLDGKQHVLVAVGSRLYDFVLN
jgi:alcohol dehydrogenase (cytochrome c)